MFSDTQGLSGEGLEIRYILLDELEDYFLESNSKLHDLGQLADSFYRFGYRDPVSFDPNLNSGKGGIVEGNGRLEALFRIRKQGRKPPRGIKLTESGRWCVPVNFGVPAKSEAEAIAFSIDHNSLTISGGDGFTALDISRLFDTDLYLAQLEHLAALDELPITVSGDDLDTLLEQLRKDEDDPNFDPVGVDEQGRLDQKKSVVCPHCNHEFQP